MKFIRKNILTAVFFSVFAILLGGALISCSNGSSSSDEDGDESSYGTKIYSESVTFSETPTQIVSAEMLANLSIKSLTIKVINVNYSGSDVWWFTAIPGSDAWSNEAKLEWQSGEGTNSLYLATITDAAAIAAYKANGIYIAGTDSATATVSVFYVEGEAEESGASSGSNSQTENSATSNETSSSGNENNGNSNGSSSSGNENNGNSDGNSSSENENNDSSSDKYICSEQSFSNSDSENSAFLPVLTSDKFSNLNINTIKIVVKLSSAQDEGWWACASATYSWNDETSVSLNWNDTDSGYSKEITTQSFISALKTNGLYIQVSKSAVGTVTVSYE